jgi:hypothetical protein
MDPDGQPGSKRLGRSQRLFAGPSILWEQQARFCDAALLIFFEMQIDNPMISGKMLHRDHQ